MPSGSLCDLRVACRCKDVIGRQGGPDRAAGIAGSRLDPNFLEAAVAQHLAVGDAIERDAAGEAEIVRMPVSAAIARVSRSTTSSVTA